MINTEETYLKFLLRTIKKPSSADATENSLYGYLSISLIAFFIALTSGRITAQLVENMSIFTTISPFISGLLTFFKIILFLGALLMADIVLTYGIIVIMYKRKVDFNQFVTRFMGLFSFAVPVAVVIGLLGFVFGLAMVNVIGYLLVSIFIGYLTAFNYLLIQTKQGNGVDFIYVLLTSNLVYLIGISSLLKSVFAPLIGSFF